MLCHRIHSHCMLITLPTIERTLAQLYGTIVKPASSSDSGIEVAAAQVVLAGISSQRSSLNTKLSWPPELARVSLGWPFDWQSGSSSDRLEVRIKKKYPWPTISSIVVKTLCHSTWVVGLHIRVSIPPEPRDLSNDPFLLRTHVCTCLMRIATNWSPLLYWITLVLWVG